MPQNNRKIGVTLLRIALGTLILKDFIIYFFNRKYLFNKNGIISYDVYTDIVNYFKLYWLKIDFDNDTNVVMFCMVGIIFATLFLLGILTRLSALTLYFLLFLFKIRNIYLLDGGDNVILVLLPLMTFTYSHSFIIQYDHFIAKGTHKIQAILNIISTYFSYAIIIQMCIIYFFSGLHKLRGEVWRNGTSLYYILNSYDFNIGVLNDWITKAIFRVKFLTWFTIGFQLSFPFLIWNKISKHLIIVLGVLLHLGIFILMRVDNFSWIMIASYAVLITDSEYRILLNKVIFNKLKRVVL